MHQAQNEMRSELIRRRSPEPFIPFAVITKGGVQHLVRRAGQFALRDEDMMLVSDEKGTTRILMSDIDRLEERRVMTVEQEKTREDLINHLNRSPFAPFSIRMSDGSTFEIVRRYQAAIGLTKGTVVSADGRASRNFHVKEILAVQDVAVA